ncbi:MAG: helix-turn-helix transcriptional regulator [bacterium]
MYYGLRKGLEDIAAELKGIRSVLACMWHSRYKNAETDLINPEVFADEYISTEECARRLGVSDQTIRNWILTGKKRPQHGWVYGIHYININPTNANKQIIRIPWNNLIQSYTKGTKPSYRSFMAKDAPKYSNEMRDKKDSHIPDPTVPKTPDFDEDLIQGY